MNKYKKMFLEDSSHKYYDRNCTTLTWYAGKIKLNYSKDDIKQYRKYQKTLKENNLVNKKTPSFSSASPKPGIFIVDLICAILIYLLASKLTNNVFFIISSIFISQYLAYAIMCTIEYCLWFVFPLMKYTKKTKSFEKYQRQTVQREKIMEEEDKAEKKRKKDNSNEIGKILDSYDYLIKNLVPISNTDENSVRREVCLEYEKTVQMIRTGSKSRYSPKYSRFVNVYLKEIFNIICENEKNTSNSKVYDEISYRIIDAFRNLQKLITKENNYEQTIQNMGIESSFIALNNLFKQDCGEDFT